MFTSVGMEYTVDILEPQENQMRTTSMRSPKHFRLNAAKIKRAQKALRARTETETIERALNLVISEHERNRLATDANDRFVKRGITVKDIYGALEQ